jgi:hypothetical protein
MRILFALCLSVVMPMVAAGSKDVEFDCPESIQTRQSLVGKMKAWEAGPGGSGKQGISQHYLEGVQFSNGPPGERVFLAPDNEHESSDAKRWTARWPMQAGDKLWLTCRYRQTTVTVTRQLPSGFRRCLVKYDTTKAIEIRRVWCEK